MKLKEIKEQPATLKKLKNLMDNTEVHTQGVFYTNSFFSQRYLCRNHLAVHNLDIEGNQVKLNITTRLERVGLLEIENTLDILVKHEAGDIPGFTPEGVYEENFDRPSLSEAISVTQQLFSVDLLLIMQEPQVTYKEFTIAGSKFTLLTLTHKLEEDFEQSVTFLFGDKEKLYFFSNFFNKDLSLRDMKMILDMIVDDNITGKAITGIKIESESGATSAIFPIEALISSYRTVAKDIVFSSGTGYIKIPNDSLDSYKLMCIPNGKSGSYQLNLESKKDTIRIYME